MIGDAELGGAKFQGTDQGGMIAISSGVNQPTQPSPHDDTPPSNDLSTWVNIAYDDDISFVVNGTAAADCLF